MKNSKRSAIIIPMANEEKTFNPFIEALACVLNTMKETMVYIVIDKASNDNTYALCEQLCKRDKRFILVWSPKNKNVVDAYIKGFQRAYSDDNDIIIEMDAGLSHDPKSIPEFINKINEGYDCVFGSRFIKNGQLLDSPISRRFLSRGGTYVSNLFLGSKLKDMTSGFEAFTRETISEILNYELLSKGHFYQTELRYLCRNKKHLEIPITYKSPSKSVSQNSLQNAVKTMLFYFHRRISFKSVSL